MPEVIAYTYEADNHCPECTINRFGSTEGTDDEGNEIGAIFSTTEWYGNEIHSGEKEAVMICGTCGEEIERVDLS